MSLELTSTTNSAPLARQFPGLQRLGSHTIDKARAQPSRLARLGQAITKSVRALSSYVVESVKVARMSRADRADHRVIRQAGGQLGELLGALSHAPDHPVDGVAADALVRALRQTVAPLALRGHSLEELVKQRLPLHLKAMGIDELEALRGGLSLARKSQASFSPGAETLFATIERAVLDEQALRARENLGPPPSGPATLSPGTAGQAAARGTDPAWNKPYEPPRSLDHILSTPALLADFKLFAEKEFNTENILFAEAATLFCRSARPGLTEADALIRDFVREGADQEINISHTQRKEVLDARAAMDPGDTSPSDRLMSAMKVALEEVGKLIMSDPCMRFIENGGNPRQS